jgi:hypothetical protein
MIRFVNKCILCDDDIELDDEIDQDKCLRCLKIEERNKETDFFKNLRNAIKTQDNLLLMGPGGSGKSEAIKKITDQLQLENKFFEIVSPTGNAAINCGGITLHTLFGFRKPNKTDLFFNVSTRNLIDPLVDDGNIKSKISNPIFRGLIKRIKSLDCLIFDEFGMISDVHFQSLHRLCKIIKSIDKPFGGIQICLLGDPFQLKPISGNYIFKAECYKQLNLKIIEFNVEQLYRFDTLEFSDMTRLLRLGIISQTVYEKLKNRIQEPEQKIMEIHYSNKAANITNKKEYDLLQTPETTYEGNFTTRIFVSNQNIKLEISDENTKNIFPLEFDLIQKQFGDFIKTQKNKEIENIKKSLNKTYGDDYMLCKLKPLVRIVCTMNHKEEGKLIYSNGTTGFVKECNKDFVIIEKDVTKENVKIQTKILENTRRILLDNNYILDIKIKFEHIPLRLGYSSTIHKVQGMTMNTALIDAKTINKQNGLVYVAISRCKSLNNMFFRSKEVKEDLDEEQEEKSKIKKEFVIDKLQVSGEVSNFYLEHYFHEIKQIYNRNPEWFNSFVVKTDDEQVIQKVISLINGTKIINQLMNTILEKDNNQLSKNENFDQLDEIIKKEIRELVMPTIKNNTQVEITNISRGSSQQQLRKWLLDNQGICAISQEHVPDILEAAHIRPLASFKENVNIAHEGNAILLRVDFHTLYDKGFISFTGDGQILHSKSMKNHEIYSKFDKITIPAFIKKEYLQWHQENVFNPNL